MPLEDLDQLLKLCRWEAIFPDDRKTRTCQLEIELVVDFDVGGRIKKIQYLVMFCKVFVNLLLA